MTQDVSKRNRAKIDLFEETYALIREIAGKVLNRHSSQSIRATELAHEMYIRLEKKLPSLNPENYLDHFWVESERFLQGRWRSKNTRKRGGGWTRVPEHEAVAEERDEACLELAPYLRDALNVLQTESAIAHAVIQLDLAGQTNQQIADSLGLGTTGRVAGLKRAGLARLKELLK